MKRTYALLALLIVTGFYFYEAVFTQETAPTSSVASRVVEDGRTDHFKAIMVSESSLSTHTVFKPSDLGAALKVR